MPRPLWTTLGVGQQLQPPLCTGSIAPLAANHHRVSQLHFSASALRRYSPCETTQQSPRGAGGGAHGASSWSGADEVMMSDGGDGGGGGGGAFPCVSSRAHEAEASSPPERGLPLDGGECSLSRVLSSDVLLARTAGPEGVKAQQRLQQAARMGSGARRVSGDGTASHGEWRAFDWLPGRHPDIQ